MPSIAGDTQTINDAPLVAAPDGSAVRVLCATGCGSMILFSLQPGAVSRAVVHRTVEEIWYFVAGRGALWRHAGDQDEIVTVGPGVCATIPLGARFQFRASPEAPLAFVAVTMPPWPGEGEAEIVEGKWRATVG